MSKKAQIFQAFEQQRFDPMNDVAFKFIFGKEERKQITIDFLNAVLQESLEHEIREITFRQTEMPPDADGGKLSRLDIACELDTGELVDVEVQVINYNDMQRRTLFYWARLYLLSLSRGEGYRILRPAITINLLAFELLPQSEPVAMYSIYNPKTGDRLNKDMELHFIEIPKYIKAPQKKIGELSKMERWLAYFANKLTDLEREELAMSEPAIKEAMEAEKLFLCNPDEYLRYVNRQMAIMDYRSNLQAAAEEGEARGEARGESRVTRLMSLLLEAGKIEEAREASNNEAVRKRLFEKYRIE